MHNNVSYVLLCMFQQCRNKSSTHGCAVGTGGFCASCSVLQSNHITVTKLAVILLRLDRNVKKCAGKQLKSQTVSRPETTADNRTATASMHLQIQHANTKLAACGFRLCSHSSTKIFLLKKECYVSVRITLWKCTNSCVFFTYLVLCLYKWLFIE